MIEETRYSAMLLGQGKQVQVRKERIEKILISLDCDLYPSLTALTEAIVRRYNEIYFIPDNSVDINHRKDLLNGSTLRRRNSPYRALVESFYKSEERMKIQLRSKKAQLSEENLILRSDIATLRNECLNLKEALKSAHQEMDLLRSKGLASRTAAGVTPKHTDAEINAFNAILLLLEAGRSSSGFSLSDCAITQVSFSGDITVVDESRCPNFFNWYRKGSR